MPGHTVRSYDQDLQRLRDMAGRMGGLAERQVADAIGALARRDAGLGAQVVRRDAELDRLEREIDALCIRLLALRQPVAQDLRLIVAVLKAGHGFERIGDYAKNAARRAAVLAGLPALDGLEAFGRMARLVQENLRGAIDALARGDAARAAEVWAADAPVDEVHDGIVREILARMMEDPRNAAGAAAHLLFIAKNLERIGDHATNIAETVHYAVRGDHLPEDRPKSSAAAAAAAVPPAGQG